MTLANDADAEVDADFKALSAEEALEWRRRHPQISPWWVILGQLAIGLLVAGLLGVLSGRLAWAGSLLYGVAAVTLPAALMARALSRRPGVAGAALLMFFVWELVKVLLTVMLLAAAPRLVPGLNWWALLAGLVLAVKMYGLVLWWRSRRLQSTV